jgi:D-Tyr-tRNAtyr deacylase
MRAVVQRVSRTQVAINGEIAGEIGLGLLVLLGVGREDTEADAEQARQLYEFFVEQLRAAGLRCETGRFQAMMQVELVNEGPVTILLDSGKGF